MGRAPLTEAYQQLVEVFLCTETTHSLPLTIEGIEEKSKWIKTMMLMKMMMLMKNNDYYGDSNWLWKKENELSDDEQLSSDHELNNNDQQRDEKDSHVAPATTHPLPAQPASRQQWSSEESQYRPFL